MTRVLLAGAGEVGAHAARHLAASGIERIFVVDADEKRRDALVGELGEVAEARTFDPDHEALTGDVDVVACAVPRDRDVAYVERALEAGIPAASSGEDPEAIDRLLSLDTVAVEARVPVIVGAGVAPGIAEVLAGHAAQLVEQVERVDVARHGVAGAASGRARRRAAWHRAWRWDDGWQRVRPGGGRRLVAFPPPLGTRECRYASSAVPRLVTEMVPGAASVVSRESTATVARLAGRRHGDAIGGVVVEVRGSRGRERAVMVFGVVDRFGAAAGGTLAVATLLASGSLAGVSRPEPGVRSLAASAPSAALLGALAERGIRSARFDSDA